MNYRALALALSGGFAAAGGSVALATKYPMVALILVGASAFCGGLAITLPQTKSPEAKADAGKVQP